MNTAPSDQRPGRNAPPAIPLADLVDGVTLAPSAPGMTTGITTSEAAPFGPALAAMPEARCALKVRRSCLLSSPDWISLFSKLG